MIGSTNSSNSVRLVEVAREHGADSHLIDFHHQVDEDWLEGVETVGITSGASAPEELVEAPGRVLPRARRHRRLRAEDRRGGRPLHARRRKIRRELAARAEGGTELPVVG